MTSAFSWQNSISLCPASFHIPRPNLPVTPGVSWLPTFAFQSPIMKRTCFWAVLAPKCLVGLHRTIQLQLLQHYWFRHTLGLPWYWMVCLGNEQRSFCPFWDCIQVRQGCIWSPCLFNLYAEYIMRNAGLQVSQAGIKIAGRNINNFRYADDPTLMAEKKNWRASWWKWKSRVKKLA